jgi:hypothetical protein
MVVAAEYAFVVERHQILFEMANDEHAPADFEQIFPRSFRYHNDQCLIRKPELVNGENRIDKARRSSLYAGKDVWICNAAVSSDSRWIKRNI